MFHVQNSQRVNWAWTSFKSWFMIFDLTFTVFPHITISETNRYESKINRAFYYQRNKFVRNFNWINWFLDKFQEDEWLSDFGQTFGWDLLIDYSAVHLLYAMNCGASHFVEFAILHDRRNHWSGDQFTLVLYRWLINV